LSEGRTTLALDRAAERAGWAHLEVVDRRGADPRSGLFSEEFVVLARSVLDETQRTARHAPLVCVFNRTGRALLLACRRCGELAQCTNCGAAVRQGEAGFECPRCAERRPVVCAACGHLRMKTLRTGVSRLREEIAALLGAEVGEVAGRASDAAVGDAPVLIGTEAVLHRVRRASAVVFLDIDLHLLAPRFSATDETLALLIRASRLVGAQPPGSTRHRVMVQTRVPEHVVLESVRRGDPTAALEAEATLRRQAGLPPYAALAALSGVHADDYAAVLEEAGANVGVTVSDLPDGRRLLHAPNAAVLSDLLARTERPGGRGLRIEVDPSAI
jgi:primosomal protein N' (replication factor Y)